MFYFHFSSTCRATTFGQDFFARERAKQENAVHIHLTITPGMFGRTGSIAVFVNPGLHNRSAGFSHDQRTGFGSAHVSIGFALDKKGVKVVEQLMGESAELFCSLGLPVFAGR